MSAPPIYIFSVHGSDNNNFFHINAIIMTPEINKAIETRPLVDSGTGGSLHRPELRTGTRIQLDKIGISNHGMKCGWNQKQTRDYLILHGSRFTHQWQRTHGTIPYYWIGKPKSHFGITLVVKA
jgi:hypothetical protein